MACFTQRDLLASVPEDSRATAAMLMRVLDSYHRDYHDTKAHPAMTLEDHAEDLKLTPGDLECARKALKRSGYSADELSAMGDTGAGSGTSRSDVMDLTFPHRKGKLIYLIAQDVYLEPEEPGLAYVYQT
jgi:hypothetical protein